MLVKQFKLEGKIQNGSIFNSKNKSFVSDMPPGRGSRDRFPGISRHQCFLHIFPAMIMTGAGCMFYANLSLKIKVKVNNFENCTRHLDEH